MMRHLDELRDVRRTYWPRYGPAVPPPDLHEDRHCTHCGYNLRGLAYSTQCPECGSVSGMSPSEAPLHFDEHQSLGSYFATLYQFFFDPDDFGSHVWRVGHLNWRAARRFRQINTAIAVLSFGFTMFVLMTRFTADAVTVIVAWCVSMIGVLLWFKSVTLDRLRFLERENLLPRDPQRSKALVSYLSAVLALAPLHLLALYGSLPMATEEKWPLAAALHAGVLALQLLAGARAAAHLFWQLIDMPRAQALWLGFSGAIVHTVTGCFYCIALPAAFTMLARNLLGG